jgi:ATP-dependent exoDNAse (exonuclease V) alpha subunit
MVDGTAAVRGHRALPVLEPGTDAAALIAEIAELAVSGRAGTDVVMVITPDGTDVTSLGVTLAHLDTKEQILTTAKQPVLPLVRRDEAREGTAGTGLADEQAEAVVTMLTAAAATVVLTAAAGAGKSRTVAEFARLWTASTGRRVIGLTTSTNAARVLQHESLAESHNIAEFLGKVEGSDELRWPVPLHSGDVLVIDEATSSPPATSPWCRKPPGAPARD